MKRGIFVASMALLSLTSTQALAFPEWTRLPPAPAAESEFFMAPASYDFQGIVALSNCSGSIIRFDDSQDTDPAMVLTNGHCVNLLDPGVVLVNQASTRTFDVLNSAALKIGKVKAQKLLYATMTKTDIGLYQLKETYQDIASRFNVPALTLARTAPALNTEIEVISGYWKRGYSCKIEANIFNLKEANWTFVDSVRYSRPGCEIIGGTSGSPVIEAGTRTVIAINNTINESGSRCQMNNPCEVNPEGNGSYEKGFGYAQQTHWIYSCRNEAGNLDLNVEGCLLPKPVTGSRKKM